MSHTVRPGNEGLPYSADHYPLGVPVNRRSQEVPPVPIAGRPGWWRDSKGKEYFLDPLQLETLRGED